MFVKDEKNWIEITFDRNDGWEYHELEEYEDIMLDFDMERVGWGNVDAHFSHKAIKEILDMLNLLLDNKIDEIHYSDDCPNLIPKPFYWLDIVREEKVFSLH